MVVEGYVPNLGFTICSGGRYDHLSERFGTDLPAVGFAFGLERLMLVLENQGQRPPEQNNGIFVLPLSWRHAVNYAAAERKKGTRAEVDIQGFSESEAVNYARQKDSVA